jgi:hypothetical protein
MDRHEIGLGSWAAMTERILLGPFLTRASAARAADARGRALWVRPDLLRITSNWLPEAYFEFQFDATGIRPDVAEVVEALKADHDDIAIADWLVRPQPLLSNMTPLGWLDAGRSVRRVLAAARSAGPT